MKNTVKYMAVIAICVIATGCASLKPKVLKSPCSPTAGLTDPCGNRVPINTNKGLINGVAQDFALGNYGFDKGTSTI